MKNPMIEANINEALFDAIDANDVNGGAFGAYTTAYLKTPYNPFNIYTCSGRQCSLIPMDVTDLSTNVGLINYYR